MKRPALGISIIERRHKGKKSFSLLARNGSEYLILVNYRILGLCLRSKLFQFNDPSQAQMVYRKITAKEKFWFSGRLAQKQYDGF